MTAAHHRTAASPVESEVPSAVPELLSAIDEAADELWRLAIAQVGATRFDQFREQANELVMLVQALLGAADAERGAARPRAAEPARRTRADRAVDVFDRFLADTEGGEPR